MQRIEHPVLIAKIGAPHGIKGEVRVTSFTENPLALGDYEPLIDAAGNLYQIEKSRPAKNVLVVRFKGIDTREAAERIRGTELFIERNSLPDDTGEDEFYITDLIGMHVFDMQNNLVGMIRDVADFGAGDLLEIAPLNKNGRFDKKTWYLAFTRQNAPEIDLQNDRITINPPQEVSGRDEENIENDHKTAK
jgi:16S rRNA processing protein RimM